MQVFGSVIDPSDVDQFLVDIRGLLWPDELVTSFTLDTMAEASLLGLSQGVGDYSTRIEEGKFLVFYPVIAPAQQNNVAFKQEVTLPLLLTVNTNSIPPRRKQLTIGVRIMQQ